jgi:DNA polymerase-3 subunit epsilon
MAQPKIVERLAALGRLLESRDWIVLDTETTGLDNKAELVEIALLNADGVIFESLVQPRRSIPREATQIHGLDGGALQQAPPFESVAGAIRQAIARRTVVGFNVKFDRSVLWREFQRSNLPAPPCRWLCIAELLADRVGERLSLAKGLAELECGLGEKLHRAAPDARATLELARRLVTWDPASC